MGMQAPQFGMDKHIISGNAARAATFKREQRAKMIAQVKRSPTAYSVVEGELCNGRQVHLSPDGTTKGVFDEKNHFVRVDVYKMRLAGKFQRPLTVIKTMSIKTNVPFDSKNHANSGGGKKNQGQKKSKKH